MMHTKLLTFMLRKSSEEVEAMDVVAVVNSTDWPTECPVNSGSNRGLAFAKVGELIIVMAVRELEILLSGEQGPER